MFTPENRIIIVDDNPSHLEYLSKPFRDKGIGCRCFEYNVNYRRPLKNVRIAFFDIRINVTGGGSEAQRLNDLATAIKQYIHRDNGPFALIFWTSNSQDIEAIKTYIQQRHDDCPRPFLVDFIDKDEFINSQRDLRRLPAKIRSILSDGTINALFQFEINSASAASDTIKQLYNIVPKNDSWGEATNFKENFGKVFSKVAMQSLGFEHAKENPDKAIYEALAPMLTHELLNSQPSDVWGNQLGPLRDSEKSKDVTFPQGFRNSTLNTIFHIDNRGLSTDARGVVLKMNKSKKSIKNAFGVSYSDWLKTFIPFQKEFKQAEAEARNAQIKELIDESTLIAIEISSACDYQQKRDRLNKYLYGIKTKPIPTVLLNKQYPESSMKVGMFSIKDEEFEVWVNLNYVFGALPSDSRLGKPLFQFKKEMMDQIGNRYANHVSRIGITSF